MGTLRMLVLLIFVLLVFAYIYPFSQNKPEIEKPEFTGQITGEHIRWVVNEIGGYMLRNAEIEVLIGSSYYTVKANGGNITVIPGRAENPDLRLSMSREDFEQLLNSTDILAEAKKLYEERRIDMNVLKPVHELATKGYEALYNTAFSKQHATP